MLGQMPSPRRIETLQAGEANTLKALSQSPFTRSESAIAVLLAVAVFVHFTLLDTGIDAARSGSTPPTHRASLAGSVLESSLTHAVLPMALIASPTRASVTSDVEPWQGMIELDRHGPWANASDTISLSTQPDRVVLPEDARRWLDEGRFERYTHKVKSGETVLSILETSGLDANDATHWLREASKVHNLDRIYIGQTLDLVRDRKSRQLFELATEIDWTSKLVVSRFDGDVTADRVALPVRRVLKSGSGEIEKSLYVAAKSAGIPDNAVSQMAEVLGWEIDLQRELQPGATFRAIWEEISRNDRSGTKTGRLVALDLTNNGKRHEAFYFGESDSNGGYYDRSGNAIGRSFLRYPVAFSRISSRFSKGRYHPIKKVHVPHYGVDFAAKTGTPVVAAGDGKIVKAGWQGGNGRIVKISHDNSYKTAYAHLSKIAPSIATGTRVKKGQLIGYVGSSGMATGPHLHYAMYKNDKYIDPLKVVPPRSAPLSLHSRQRLTSTVKRYDALYAEHGTAGARYAKITTISN